jgi:hypothetical protein
MSKEIGSRVRYGEAFWRAHHEAWQQSALNQRQYCEAHGIPLKAFGNWRARFKSEFQLSSPKLLYRRRGLSHRLSHMTNGSPMSGPTCRRLARVIGGSSARGINAGSLRKRRGLAPACRRWRGAMG